MKESMNIRLLNITGSIVIGVGAWTNVLAEPNSPAVEEAALPQTQVSAMISGTENYWTPERMARAKPMPIPTKVLSRAEFESAASEVDSQVDEQAAPGYGTGCSPRKAATCESVERIIPLTDSLYAVATGAMEGAQPQHGSKPGNPKTGPYGPFQRWTEFDAITVYPKSTHGKLFFTLSGTNFVCSATVVNRSTLITAGHCNSDGNGHFATNRLFCPSYRNGANPARGCWSVVTSVVAGHWHSGGDPDYDYACLVTANTGSVVANKIGNVTGWMGRAWNWSSSQAERTFGYPQAAPFNGNRLITTASSEWYTHDFVGGGQVSKVIGSDLTGGSSGGSWAIGWSFTGHEFPDTDGSGSTDPGANWVNGVNSHKRCLVNCATPPTATNGVFWQEMTSPPFRNTGSDNDESEDVLALCFANGNNNP